MTFSCCSETSIFYRGSNVAKSHRLLGFKWFTKKGGDLDNVIKFNTNLLSHHDQNIYISAFFLYKRKH